MRLVLVTLLAAVCQAQGNWSYLTYLGGSGSESIRAVSSDGAGGTFVAGETYSIGPPFSAQDPGIRSVPSVFVARIDAAGQMVFAKVLGDGSASALAVDADGNVYVVESYHDYLLVFNRNGELLLPIGGTGAGIGQFYLPTSVWTDASNRIFVADMFNGRVAIFQSLADK